MTGSGSVCFDHDRARRIGLDEAILGDVKRSEQLAEAIEQAHRRTGRVLITRLDATGFAALSQQHRQMLDFDPVSRTAMSAVIVQPETSQQVLILTGGTADLGVAREAARTLEFHGVASRVIPDIGVAGLWRVLEHRDLIASAPVVVVCAGMEGALFSVVGGLASGVVIAVPTSKGYGVAEGGHAALNAALASCAPGVAVTNIDSGYGAACIALRVLARWRDSRSG